MKKMVFAMMLGWVLFASCDNTPVIIDPIDPIVIDSVQGPFKLKWQFQLNDKKEKMYCPDPLLVNNNILYSRIFTASDGMHTLRDTKTGEMIWNWNESSSGGDHEQFNVSESGVGVRSRNVYSVDLITGATVWEYDEDDYGGCRFPRVSAHDKFVYTTQYNCVFSGRVSRVVRSPMDAMDLDTIATIVNPPGVVAMAEPPITFPTSDGDTLIIFQNRGDSTDLYAYSLNTREQVWKRAHVDPFGVGNIFPMMISDGKLYYVGQFNAMCLDPLTGEVLWTRAFGADNVRCIESTPLVSDGKVFIKSDLTGILCLDANTGAKLWQNNAEGSAAPGSRVVKYKDYVMYVGRLENAIFIHKISNGELVYKLQSPNRVINSFDMLGLAVDEEAGLLFTSDGFFGQCYKIGL